MALDLEANPKERAIRYTVTFDLDLDFTHFVHMANAYIPGYLNEPVNAIRPVLDGMAYHYSYNYLFDMAGGIRDNQALFKLFASRLLHGSMGHRERFASALWQTGV